MRKFTLKEKSNGELACRNLSEKASKYLSVTSPVYVWEYLDIPDNVDIDDIEFDKNKYKKYAIDDC